VPEGRALGAGASSLRPGRRAGVDPRSIRLVDIELEDELPQRLRREEGELHDPKRRLSPDLSGMGATLALDGTGLPFTAVPLVEPASCRIILPSSLFLKKA